MLCEGAMMCALTALLLLINRVAGGMIETAFPWLLVFPLLVYCARYGVRTALIFCVSILLLSLMLCTFTTLFYVFSASLCALAYGSGVRRGAANRSLLLRTGLISFLSNLLSMVVLASLFGYDPQRRRSCSSSCCMRIRRWSCAQRSCWRCSPSSSAHCCRRCASISAHCCCLGGSGYRHIR